MNRLCIIAATLSAAFAQTGWVGMSYDGSTTVTINELDAQGGIVQQFSKIKLDAGEHPNVDAFRCVPYGNTCFFPTESPSGAFLYNLTVSGELLQKVPLGAVTAHNVHARKENSAALLLVHELASSDTYIIQVVGNKPSGPLVNLTSTLTEGWTVMPGSTTQCSNNEHMWVAASDTKGGNGLLVQVDILGGKVVRTTPLKFPGFASLWADCNDQTGVDTIGGTVLHVSSAGRALVYGTVTAGGAFESGPTLSLPTHTPPLAPTGLLTMPDGYDLAAAVYPEGAVSGAGYLAFADFGGNTWQLQPMSYMLWGAGRWM